MARKRARWKRYQNKLDPGRLVFVDETWAKTNMTRTHGRAARGERLVAKVPHGRWTTLTFIAALRCDAITAPLVLDQPINGEWFLVWVEQALIPPSSRATWSSWTTSAATRARLCEGLSEMPEPTCCCCRPTAPI